MGVRCLLSASTIYNRNHSIINRADVLQSALYNTVKSPVIGSGLIYNFVMGFGWVYVMYLLLGGSLLVGRGSYYRNKISGKYMRL